MAKKLLFTEYEEHLDLKGWTGKSSTLVDWAERWDYTPSLGDPWPHLHGGKGYMEVVRVHFLPIGKSLAVAGDKGVPEKGKVVVEYSSRVLEENVITLRGKVDVMECGLGDTFTPVDGAAATKLNFKTAKLFPYQEFRVRKVFNTEKAPSIISADIKNIVGRVNTAAFSLASEFVQQPPGDAEKWTFGAEQLLLIGVDCDTWEVRNSEQADYYKLRPVYKATYIFGARCGADVKASTPITWNHIFRPRVMQKQVNGMGKTSVQAGDNQELFSTTAGKWGTLSPALYEKVDFSKLWTVRE